MSSVRPFVRLSREQHARAGQQAAERGVKLCKPGVPRRNPGGHDEVYPGFHCLRISPHPFAQSALHSVAGYGVANLFTDGITDARHTVR